MRSFHLNIVAALIITFQWIRINVVCTAFVFRHEGRLANPPRTFFDSFQNYVTSHGSENTETDITAMKVSEIRTILKHLNIDYADCFDKESLVTRLQDAQAGNVKPKIQTVMETVSSKATTVPTPSNYDIDPGTHETLDLDEVSLLQEIRSMKVRELKEELASRQIRWGGLLEKEDLVRSLFEARKAALRFSVTGIVQPGNVADLTADQLEMEFTNSNNNTSVTTPILLDVYATWCGPCKIMAEQLKNAANDGTIRDRVRFVKLDSDKYSSKAGSLRVGGLPTLILFDSTGKEIDRVEGAMMKDQLIQWVASKI